MKLMASAVALLVAAASMPVNAQVRGDFGKREYESKCAVCHGHKGRGDGPYAGMGTQPVADLATLARRNNGTFPFQKVYEVIEGSSGVKSHGTREMPIWGREYRVSAGEAYFDVPYDPEAFVRTRLLALTEYLNRLQVK